MKKCYFEISARQTGKTHRITEMIAGSKSLNIIICANSQMIDNILKRGHVNRDINHFYTLRVFKTRMSTIGLRPLEAYDNAYIDEYLFFGDGMKYLYDVLPSMVRENVYIKTSPYKMYDQKVFNLVKTLKSPELNGVVQCVDFTSSWYGKQASELYHNFITDPKTILDHRPMYTGISKERLDLQLGKMWR